MNNCFDCYLNNKKPVHFTYLDFCCASCKVALETKAWENNLFLYNMRESLNNKCTETLTKDSINRLFYLYMRMRTSFKNIDNLLKNDFTKRSLEGREGVIEYYINKELRGE